ncbi:hypothetical protein [Bacillus sp. SM2101]|uniref:hypothetical protein n=1 Tax=Bacillus sp. SM2101 TaxID=2805366 RepID=UPI001BDF1201|nr:hypothetical protein [Bacillus sp. SM2101]
MKIIYSLIITSILLSGCSGGGGGGGEVSNVHKGNAVQHGNNLVFNYGGNTYTIVGKEKSNLPPGEYFNVVLINGKPELTN